MQFGIFQNTTSHVVDPTFSLWVSAAGASFCTTTAFRFWEFAERRSQVVESWMQPSGAAGASRAASGVVAAHASGVSAWGDPE